MAYHVMLVGDDYITNLIDSAIFENLEQVSQVSSFTNPSQALQYLRSRCVPGIDTHPLEPLPDLLLVDLKMVPIDGFDFLTELKHCCGEAFYKICIAVLTCSLHPRDHRLASELQVATYLAKPLTEPKARQLLAVSNAMRSRLPYP